MGDPRKTRKKFSRPMHPWEAGRINDEAIIKKEYGLTNKKEIWKTSTELRRLKLQAKKLIRERNKPGYSQNEEKDFLKSLEKFGWVTVDSPLEAVLALEPKELLERRLQTVVFKKGFALSPKQSRQFIVHGHVTINGRKITIPGYKVTSDEEHSISFFPTSTLSKEDHPERAKKLQAKEKIRKSEIKQEEGEIITEQELEKIEKEIVVEVAQ